MAKVRGPVYNISDSKKKTSQGSGTYSRAPHSGGETFYDEVRAGSPPSKSHRRKKPYRGQGR